MKQVLFVCIENACRSQMAAAFARHQNLTDLKISSAGSRPSGVVNPRAIQFMGECGIDISTQSSRSLADLPDLTYDTVVTMGCGDACPWVKAKIREDWPIPDPKDLPDAKFREIRDDISTRVVALCKRLRIRSGPTA